MPEQPTPRPDSSPRRRIGGRITLSRRTATLSLLALAVAVLTAVAALLPVPYVVLGPGPTENTLGTLGKTPLINIEGRTTYPAKGNLNLVTVLVSGGPGSHLDLFTALRGWIDPDVAVVPVESVFAPDTTADQVRQRNAEEMTLSQQDATVAALHHLGIPVTERVAVHAVLEGAPAEGRLKAGDIVLDVDGTKATNADVVRSTISAHRPGDEVAITVQRDGKTLTERLTTIEDDGRTVVGFIPGALYTYPFTVEIDPGNIGGPSAGLMFSLGVIDKLTPGDLTGGAFVAGTGTINVDGEVGPIGSIPQKMIGAREAGARWFFVPTKNCAEAVGAAPDGLRLVKVSTLDDALDSLEAISTGRGLDALPACSS
ncbi:MAG TPA: PDZ domain-containing protein [Actinomycetes bacterium]|nr:PDZ domain-containing protein [Actinomycetes bacterium]